MTEQLREKIAEQVYYWLARPLRDETNWNETMWAALSEKDREYYKKYYADVLIVQIKKALPDLAKEAGYVKLAKDQTLPPALYDSGEGFIEVEVTR